MNPMYALALSTGIFSGLWVWTSDSLGLLSWAGFLGCTTYFAINQEGVKGALSCALTNISGVAWAMMIIAVSQATGHAFIGYILTAIVAFFMCIQAQQRWLSYVPGTFVGACATFASNGDWKTVIPSLLLGLAFGIVMKEGGKKLGSSKKDSPVANQPLSNKEQTPL
ncbi:DUF1097 domain-containing protein [Parasalinivibrio latis]|uniref:DUF1097 domain-containing protein n=1 Tax=Parasalinivibrio latis TaxID=2952610 RepID=UPI0030E0F194